MFHVKHPDDLLLLNPNDVVAAVGAAGVVVTDQQATLLIRHAELVVEANRQMNLTRLTTADEVLSLHIVDSLAFLPHVRTLTGAVIDIGSGAGYPGLPLAIMGWHVTLCESVKKKAAFLEWVSGRLDLDVTVKAVRAEELAIAQPEAADCVIARAVSSTASLVELASPLLRRSGRLIALKGVPDESELTGAGVAAQACGMRLDSKVEYSLPSGDRRTVLVFEKSGRPRIALPRRPGAAQRQPLG